MIFDEAHNLKNYTSKKTQAGADLAKKAERTLLLTATPGDKAEHVGYLATAFGFNFMKAMAALGYRRGEYGFELAVPLNESMLRLGGLFDDLTRRGLMVKREVSMDNIDVRRGDVTLPPEQVSLMARAWGELENQTAKAPPRRRGLTKMLGLSKLRTALEPYKIDTAVSMTQADVQAGKKVVIFANRINDADLPDWWPDKSAGEQSVGTLDELASRLEAQGLTVGRLYGKHLRKAKATLGEFQTGETQVIIATPQAGGTGINLDDTVGDRPRSMLVMTAPFSSLEAVQQIGRINRLTTASRASVRFIKAEDVHVDEWNFGIIRAKLARLGASVEGDVADLDLDRLGDLSDEDLRRLAETPSVSRERRAIDLAQLGLRFHGGQKTATGTEAPAAKTKPMGSVNGRNYVIGWQGETRYGHRTKLVRSDGSEFWVDTSEVKPPQEGPVVDKAPDPTPSPDVVIKPMTDDQIEATRKALNCVAGQCDGAWSRDGEGFNKQDALSAHHLMSISGWTVQEAARARDLVYKYKRQYGDDLAQRMGNPREAAEIKPTPGVKTAVYKGRTYAVGYSGKTKFGHRTKLIRADGGEFWVDTSAVSNMTKALRVLFFRPLTLARSALN